ncbi:MAG TPA: DUF3644 domain-containing protein [Candidatus Saccharimonadales bacterium]|nr:DUF3644 domain-containing protein [Candidatus Saccharimonadales bacterium]
MKSKEVEALKDKSINSLIFAIEVFNRPYDTNRQDLSLISLDHSFEIFLKAAILFKGGVIRENRNKDTYGFEKCVNLATDSKYKFVDENQARTLKIINSLRDAAQHYILRLSEEQLYLHIQSGVTLFSDLLLTVFNEKLGNKIPERVLPISINPPRDLAFLVENDISRIKPLLTKGKRKKFEAKTMVRGLAIMDGSIQGKSILPTDKDLDNILVKIQKEEVWDTIFPGVAALKLNTEGDGTPVHLRFSKNDDAIPIRTVNIEGDENLPVVGIKRVNELDYYKFGVRKVAKKINLTEPKTRAIIEMMRIKNDLEYFKVIKINNSEYKLYSQKAIDKIKVELPNINIEEVWQQYKNRNN